MIGGVPVLDESGRIAENTFQIGDLVDVVPPPRPPQSSPAAHPSVAAQQSAITAQSSELKPRAIIKSIRARIKAIRSELKSHAALQDELAELERLLAAATGKPLAPVRNIESARRSG